MSAIPTIQSISGKGKPRLMIVKEAPFFQSTGGEVYGPLTARGCIGKAIDLDGSTEYASKSSPVNLDMNDGELLTNGGFETATGSVDDGITDTFTGWSQLTTGGIIDSTATVHGGSKAVKIIRNAASNLFIYQNAAVTPGRTYTLEFWTRGDGTNAGNYYIYDVTNSAYIVASTLTGVPGTTYTKVVKNFVVPSTCVTVQIALMGSNVNPSTVYFDDASLTLAYDFTVLMQMKLDAAAADNPSIVGRSFGWRIYQNPSGTIIGSTYDGVTTFSVTKLPAYPFTGYSLVAFTVDRDGNGSLYWDGQLVTASSHSSMGKVTGSGSLYVGTRDTSQWIDGQIGELQIIRGYAMTAEEVLDAFNNGIKDSIHTGEIVAHYKWRGSTDAEMLKDLSGTGNDLTGTNVTQAGDQVVGAYKVTDGLTSVARVGMRVSAHVSGTPNKPSFGKVISIDSANDELTVDSWSGGQPTDAQQLSLDGWIVDLPRCQKLTERFTPDVLVHRVWRRRRKTKHYGWEYQAILDYSRYASPDMLYEMRHQLAATENDRLILIPRADAPGFQYNVYFDSPVELSRFGRADGYKDPVFVFSGKENIGSWPILAGYGSNYATDYGNNL